MTWGNGFIPPEVEFYPFHGQQKLALRDNGERFSQYIPCSEGCGYLIGCGDAIETVAHISCLARTARITDE